MSVVFSQGAPLRMRVERRLPALSSFCGHKQGQKLARRRLEGANLAHDFARSHAAATGDNGILVNIQARAVGIEYVHDHPPVRRRHGTSVKGTLENMLRGRCGPWQTLGCSEVPDPTKQRALPHQENTDLSASGAGACLSQPLNRFIPSGSAAPVLN
jgi:hypothetical protein